MQLQPGSCRPDIWPLSCRFLNPVFPKDRLSGLQDRQDVFRPEGLAHRDQRNLANLAASRLGGAFNVLSDLVQGLVLRWIHAVLMAKLAGHFKDW